MTTSKLVSCKCKICKANAAKLGLPVLSANVPEILLAQTKGKAHGWVYLAHDPAADAAAARARTGVTPA